MKILSIDPGIINLSYTLFEIEENTIKIVDWDIINIIDSFLCETPKCKKKATFLTFEKQHACVEHKGKKHEKLQTCKTVMVEDLTMNILKSLEARKHLLDIDYVLIENQPSLKNPKMKAVSSCIFNYFLIRGKLDSTRIKSVIFMSAVNKLKFDLLDNDEKVKELKKTKSYATNKKLSIIYCQKLIEKNISYKEFFSTYKKKDDLADSFLQGYYYINKNYSCNVICDKSCLTSPNL
jgi:hypothetical protein